MPPRAAAVGAAAGVDAAGAVAEAAVPMASPDGKWTAVVRDTPPPKREKVYESEFAKRHEERFKGVAVRLDGVSARRGALPAAERVDPDVNPPQEIFLTPAAAPSSSSRISDCVRPARTGITRARSLVFTADSGVSQRDALRPERHLDRRRRRRASARLTTSTDFSYAGARYSPDGKWILATRSTPTDAVIAKKMDNGGPVDIVVLPASGGTRDEPHGGLGLPPVGAVLEPGRQVHLLHRRHRRHDASLPRVAPSGGAVEQVTTGQRRLSAFSYDRALTKMAYQVGTLRGAVGDLASPTSTARASGNSRTCTTRS